MEIFMKDVWMRRINIKDRQFISSRKISNLIKGVSKITSLMAMDS